MLAVIIFRLRKQPVKPKQFLKTCLVLFSFFFQWLKWGPASSFDSSGAAILKDSRSVRALSALQKKEAFLAIVFLSIHFYCHHDKSILKESAVKREADTTSDCRLPPSQAPAVRTGLKGRHFGLDCTKPKPFLSPQTFLLNRWFLPKQSKTLLGNVHILHLTYSYSICWTKSEC